VKKEKTPNPTQYRIRTGIRIEIDALKEKKRVKLAHQNAYRAAIGLPLKPE